jgi:hydrogenase expression/formation protein HypC
MCLSLPGKVVAVEGDYATVDYERMGQRDNVRLDLVKVEVGDFVLVQGGFAVRVLSEEEAEQTLRMWEMVYEEMEGEEIGGMP